MLTNENNNPQAGQLPKLKITANPQTIAPNIVRPNGVKYSPRSGGIFQTIRPKTKSPKPSAVILEPVEFSSSTGETSAEIAAKNQNFTGSFNIEEHINLTYVPSFIKSFGAEPLKIVRPSEFLGTDSDSPTDNSETDAPKLITLRDLQKKKFYKFPNRSFSDLYIMRKLNKITNILENKCIRFNLILSGNIGVGKTTILNKLKQLFINNDNTKFFNEFIHNDELALKLLKKRLNGEISAFTLQNYIYDKWLYNTADKPFKILNIYERFLSESSFCFIDNLSPEEVNFMKKREAEIVKISDIPSVYNSEPLHVAEIWTTRSENTAADNLPEFRNVSEIIYEIYTIIKDDIKKAESVPAFRFDRVIYLKTDPAKELNNIQNRGRDGEENYDENYIKTMNNRYEMLFKYLCEQNND